MTALSIVHVVCTDAFAGVERYVLGSALGLTRAGHSVTVVGGSESAMREPLERGGADWLPGTTVRQALGSLRRIRRPDVLITNMTQADLAGVVASRRLRVPVVSIRHFASRRGSSPIFRLIAGWIARQIAAQIAISEFVQSEIDGPSTVVHTGVGRIGDEEFDRKPFVLVAQRLELEKHTEVAVRAWARVADRGDWRLRIAGQGAELDRLVSLATSLGIAASVDFLGFRSDMDSLYSQASILVAPTPREGLGLSVIEAMAYGLPVVAARGGGHLESVGAVVSPSLFEPGDDSAAALHITRLMADPVERRRYGDALRERQRSAFSIDNQTAGTVRILTSVAGG